MSLAIHTDVKEQDATPAECHGGKGLGASI